MTDTLKEKTLFGIKMSALSLALVREVESLYGKRVIENGPCEIAYHQEAVSCISPDGAPSIKFNANFTPTESMIVHELFHLKLSAEGFPYVLTLIPNHIPKHVQDYLAFMVSEVYDSIEHTIIYPRMSAMGLQPDHRLNKDIDWVITRGDFQYGGMPPRRIQTLFYFQGKLLSGDRELITRYTQWFESNEWSGPLAIANTLVEKVRRTQTITPESAIPLLIECLNELKLEGGEFKFHSVQPYIRGNQKQRILYLEFMPRQ